MPGTTRELLRISAHRYVEPAWYERLTSSLSAWLQTVPG
jgi:hypothetical protein